MSSADNAEASTGDGRPDLGERDMDAPDQTRDGATDEPGNDHGDEHGDERGDEHGEPAGQDLPHTGDDAVDRALESLPGIADADPAEQLDTYVGVHRALQDRLADSGV